MITRERVQTFLVLPKMVLRVFFPFGIMETMIIIREMASWWHKSLWAGRTQWAVVHRILVYVHVIFELEFQRNNAFLIYFLLIATKTQSTQIQWKNVIAWQRSHSLSCLIEKYKNQYCILNLKAETSVVNNEIRCWKVGQMSRNFDSITMHSLIFNWTFQKLFLLTI